jgi:hypothetical protein
MRDIMKRLEALEKKIRPQHLTILASLNGEQVEMTVQECIDKGGSFIKVLDGCNLKDVDLILDIILQQAINDTRGSGDNDQ